MELSELKKRAIPYLVKNEKIIATIDGQFFYTTSELDALAYVEGKKENIFLITRVDVENLIKKEVDVEEITEEVEVITEETKEVTEEVVVKPKTEAQIRYEDRLKQLEPYKDLIDLSKLKINTGVKTFEKMLKEAISLKK